MTAQSEIAALLRRYPPLGSWVDRAACGTRDPEMWHPTLRPAERKRFELAAWERQVAVLRDICSRCPVQAECLGYALATGVDGFWGGLTDEERQEVAA